MTLARVAIGTFMLFYGAAAAGAVQTLWDDFVTGDLLFLIGSIAWVVAVIAAAAAYRQIGAPLIVSILLALSAIAVFHAPPIGPIGLLLLAGAVMLLAAASGPR